MIFLVLLLLLLPVPAYAVPCSVTFNLQNGQPADATQVMQNYNDLINCLKNAAANGANNDITSISGLTSPLAPSQGGTPVYIGATSSGTNALVIGSTTPTNFSLIGGLQVLFLAGGTNTGAATLTVNNGSNTTGAITVAKQTTIGLQPLLGGEILAGQIYAAAYDGAVFQLLNPSSSSSILAPSNITGTYTVVTSDCGKTLSLGGAFYAVTFAAPASFASGCSVRLVDASTTRGKGIVISGKPTVRLFPLQTITVTQNAGVWVVDPQSQLWVKDGPTFFVNHVSGSDNPAVSDCLSSGAGACSTFQNAVNIVQLLTLPGISGPTIQADCEGNYDQTALGPANSIQVYRGLGSLINFLGNAGSPVSCTLLPNINTVILDVQDGQQATITGFELGFNGGAFGTAVSGRQIVILDVDNCYFANNPGGIQVSATDLASVNIANVTLNGAAQLFVSSAFGSQVQVNGVIIPGAGSASFSFWYDATDGGSIAGTPAYSVAGAVGGAKYACGFNATINLGTAYPAALTAGSATTGCQVSPP